MSENVEIVRSLYDAWERADFAFGADLIDPDIEIVFTNPIDRGTYRGRSEMLRAWKKYIGPWDEFHAEIEEIREKGEHVVVLTRLHGRGPSSQAPVESPAPSVVTLRDGKVVRLLLTHDRERALHAAGLRE